MKTVTYKCDRCDEVIAKPTEDAFHVVVMSGPVSSGGASPLRRQDIVAEGHWCRTCAIQCHAVAPDESADVVPPQPTLEDMVRDIVREEMEE